MMGVLETLQRAVGVRKDKLIFVLQGLTAVGVLLTIVLFIHVGPLTMFTFMTVAQGLIVVSLVGTSILLITQRTGITRERYGPGEIIVRKGEAGEKVYIVEQGEVEAIDEEPGGGERIIATLGDGKSFGEIALVTEHPYLATVRSRTAVTLISVDRESFQALLHHAPLRRMVEGIIEERSKKLREVSERGS